MRLLVSALLGVALVLSLAACTGGSSGDRTTGQDPSGTPSAPVDSREGFTAFSGLTVPASATDVTIKTTVDTGGQPAYRVRFRLPSADLDSFCTAGQMDRPLRVVTIPDEIRQTFDYQGDSSTGVAISEAGLPADQRIQRTVFALGTKTTTADVQVYAYRMPS